MSYSYPSNSSSGVHVTSSANSSSHSAESVRAEVDRKLAMACLAGFTLLFSLITWMFQRTAESGLDAEETPPKFLTEIPNASNEEWMLLPGVGEKTAKAWRKDLTVEDNNVEKAEVAKKADVTVPSKVTVVDSLEDLRGVGPSRANQLAPYVANLKSNSTNAKSTRGNPRNPTSFAGQSADK